MSVPTALPLVVTHAKGNVRRWLIESVSHCSKTDEKLLHRVEGLDKEGESSLLASRKHAAKKAPAADVVGSVGLQRGHACVDAVCNAVDGRWLLIRVRCQLSCLICYHLNRDGVQLKPAELVDVAYET